MFMVHSTHYAGLADTQVCTHAGYLANSSMFIGEFLCCIPLLWSHWSRSSKTGSPITRLLSKVGLATPSDAGYARVQANEDEEEDQEEDEQDKLTGWRMLWMWFPAFFDSTYSDEAICSS
jgi:hypothetical protein